MQRTLVLGAVLGILAWGPMAHAGGGTYDFSGTIDLSIIGDPFGTLSTGEPFHGSFTYDDSTPQAPPFVPFGTAYNALTNFSMTIGGETITSSAGAMVVHNDEGGVDFLELLPFITFPAGSMDPNATLGGLLICGGCFSIVISDDTATVFGDESLPAALDLGDFPPPDDNVVRFSDLSVAVLTVQSPIASLGLNPQALLSDLMADLIGMNLQAGIANSLDAKLNAAFNALDDLNENNDVAALNSLYALINAVEAQRGRKLTDAQADSLVAAAQAVIAAIEG